MAANADIVRASYEAWHRGDAEGVFAAFAPDIEWTHPDGLDDLGLGGTRHGKAEVMAFQARVRSLFSELRVEPHEYVEDGDRVMVIGLRYMRAAATGRSCTIPFVHAWRFANGKATHFYDYHDTEEIRRIVTPDPDRLDGLWRIVETGLGFWAARTLMSAVELGVFTELAQGTLTLDELVARLGLHPRGARDFLDSLVAMGLLDHDGDQYRNAPAADAYLDRAKPETYVGSLLEVGGQQWWDGSWRSLTTALQSGRPQSPLATADDPFDLIYADGEGVRQFAQAMASGSLGPSLALVEKFPWSRYRTVVDVGACGGALLRRLLTRHPHLRGVGFDLAPVEPAFTRTAQDAGLSDRMRFCAGNFRTDALPSSDVMVIGHVLHDWDLDTRRLLLRRAYEAVEPGGAVVVYDSMIDDEPRQNLFGLLTSLHMLLESPGGADYTGQEARGWLAEAGFRDCFVEHLSGPESMAVGFKPGPGR